MTTHSLPEARRALGAEWMKNHPRMLEHAYAFSKRAFYVIYPLMKKANPRLAERVVLHGEKAIKQWLFNCQMCGQCILHSTGMTCPMNCPKNLRNGPCGGVRANGHCEVIPNRMCIWVQAWERNQHMTLYVNEMQTIQPPVNRALQHTASWVNMFEGTDQIKNWVIESSGH